MSKVAVIGAGAWGTALAIQAMRAGNAVTLWARDPARAQTILAARENPRLAGIGVPEPVLVTSVMPDSADATLLAVPAQHLRGALGRLPIGLAPLVVCAKGVEQTTLRLPLEIAADVRPGTPSAILTGPNFAHEIAAGLPAAAVVAASDTGLREAIAALLGTPSFRLYGNDDPIGAQVGGAAKNVVAIAAGAVIGAGLGENARAALITRGLAELSRLAVALGGKAGDGDGAVGARRPAADLHRSGEPQLQPRTGAGARRAACRRAGGAKCRHRGGRHGASPCRSCRGRGPADLHRGRIAAGRTHDAWPRRSPRCWHGRGGTNDPRRPHRRRLDHGEPHPRLRPRHADRGDPRCRSDRRCVLRRAEAAQPVPPPVRRGRVQCRLRPRLRRHARSRGPSRSATVRRGDVRRHGVLARCADHRGRGVHAADDGGAGARLCRDPGEVRARRGTVAHHLPLSAADLPRRAGVGRAERARPLHRGLCLLCAVQRRLDRLHAVADALRADRGPRAVLGRSPHPAWRSLACCCGRCIAPAWGCRCRARA